MADFDGYVIEWAANDGNLFASEDGIDVAASADNFYQFAVDALEKAFPGAVVNLTRQNAVGYEKGIRVYSPGDLDEGATFEAQRVIETVFEDGFWYVEA